MKTGSKKPNVTKLFDVSEFKQIISWLDAANLHEIEIEGGGQRFHVVMSVGKAEPFLRSKSQGETGVAVIAPSAGIFLVTHPDRANAFVSRGDSIKAGDILAILKIGELLIPINAPKDGVVVSTSVAPGSMVEYGTKLFEIEPINDGK